MPYQPAQDDPFAGGAKTPAVSWKGLPIGSVFVLEVLEAPKLLQSRNYDSNQPDYWDEAKTQPKMSAVINVRVIAGPHSVGEQRSVWAAKPSSLFVAIAEAQKQAAITIAPGGKLSLKFESETTNPNPRHNPMKNYLAKYEPPADAFAQPAPPVPQWGQPGPHTPPSSQPAGWPQTQPQAAQPALPGPAPRGASSNIPF